MLGSGNAPSALCRNHDQAGHRRVVLVARRQLVETQAGDGVILGQGLRYAHGAAYVRASVEAAGLALLQLEDLSARNEDNAPVPGLVAVASRIPT